MTPSASPLWTRLGEEQRERLRQRDIVIESRFAPEFIPDEMPSDEDLARIGRRLMQRAMKAKAER